MKIQWEIEQRDFKKARSFFDQYHKTPFVRKQPVTRTDFWRVMMGCLLTTQQRSEPDTPVTRFLFEKPFPLSYKSCRRKADLAGFVKSVLSDFGGLRRSTKMGEELTANMRFLAEGGGGGQPSAVWRAFV